MPRALICGLAGTELAAEEARALREGVPCGIILFARNLADHAQIRRLVGEAREAAGAPCLVLIDQEGGRVQRLRPPLGRALPRAADYARRFAEAPARAIDAARRVAHLTAVDLRALGIDTNCTPVLDVPQPGAHEIIGDRAFGTTPGDVAVLGRAVAEGTMAGGVLPVVKHIPGHGRANADSHLALPVVTAVHAELTAVDFAPFAALADMPAAMTAHVVFTALDAERAASVSPVVHAGVIRGEIGFDGFLMSDDLGMKALTGSMRSRAEAVIAAGSDCVLHCSGDLDELRSAAEGAPLLTGRALSRFVAALTIAQRTPEPLDVASAEAALAWISPEAGV